MSVTTELLLDANVVADSGVVPGGWVLVEDGLIIDVGTNDRKAPGVRRRTSVAGAYVLPGFIDIHVHGGGGDSFADGLAAANRAACFHAMSGTTSLLAGLVSAPKAPLLDQVRQLIAGPEVLVGGGRMLGIHLEGPFLSPVRRGAHDPELLRPPDPEELAALCEASGGRARLVTAAPELDGFPALAGVAQANGAVVALGHTDADGPTLMAAIGIGARSLTHTFNGMRPVQHRDPGPLEVIVDSDVFCELICDGVHVHPTFVRLLRQLAGKDRVVLVTDAAWCAGLPDGEYRTPQRHLEVSHGAVHLCGSSTLAGSTLTMGEAVRRYARFTGAGVAELACVASTNAARLLGEDGRLGRVKPGYQADLVVVDRELRCAGVMSDGRWARPLGAAGA